MQEADTGKLRTPRLLSFRLCVPSLDGQPSTNLPSHAKVRSTTHRLGSRTKPFALSGRLTVSSVHSSPMACRSLSPAYPPSVKIWPQTWELFTGILEQIGSNRHGPGCWRHELTIIQQKPEDVGHNMTLAPFGLFASVIAAKTSAFPGQFLPLWLSITPAVGSAARSASIIEQQRLSRSFIASNHATMKIRH